MFSFGTNAGLPVVPKTAEDQPKQRVKGSLTLDGLEYLDCFSLLFFTAVLLYIYYRLALHSDETIIRQSFIEPPSTFNTLKTAVKMDTLFLNN